MIYILGFALSIILARLSDNGIKKDIRSERRVSIILYIASVLILALIMGLRYGIGTDYYQYMSAFTTGGGEFRGLLLNVIRDFFVQNGIRFEHFIFISSIFVVGCFSYSIWKRLPCHVQPLSIYLLSGFYFSAFNGIRQAISISIVFYALSSLDDRRLFRYSILVCFAALFHSSAFAAIALIPCRFIVLTRKRLLALLGACCVIGITAAGALFALAQYTEYSFYLNYDRFLGGNISLADTALVSLSLILCYRFLPTSLEAREPNSLNLRIWMLIIAFLFCVLSSQQFIFSRFISLFSVAMIDANPKALDLRTTDKTGWLVAILYWVVLACSCYMRYWILGIDEVVPYQSHLMR